MQKTEHLKIFGANTSVLAVVILLTGYYLLSCARQGSPEGGPKDETPPEAVSEMPPNRSVYFNSKNAVITFNEFIQLKDPAKEIFISPPMRLKPEFKALGKKVIIEFKEELKENSTYTFNFGSSIVDYTESNPIVNYEYVFSTGGHIDSLSIPGKVLNSFNLQPEPDIIAMVYLDDNDTIPIDSLPLKVQPKSASKTTKDGNFRINNLSAGKYKLFALQDFNNNYLFDLPNERIAFLDSLVTISAAEQIIIPVDSLDTLDTLDTLETVDTVAVAAPAIQMVKEDSYTLYLFEEIDSTQKLISKKLIGHSLLQYIFRLPADSVKIQPIGFEPARPDWYVKEFSNMKDTVNFWLKEGLPDTIRVCVSPGDSLVDTSRYVLSKSGPERLGKKKEEATSVLRIIANTTAGSLDLNKKLTLLFAIPVKDYDTSKLTLFTPTDTLVPAFSFTDTLQRQGEIIYDWNPDESYHLMIEDSAFSDLGGTYNDSTSINFKVRRMEDYGILILNVTLPDTSGSYIIQLMSDKEIILRQYSVTSSGLVRFDYLMPGNYKLKAVFDANSNGKWDTGNYRKNSLPEQVEYYIPALNIRANWDLQEEWQLKQN